MRAIVGACMMLMRCVVWCVWNSSINVPSLDEWVTAASQTVARRQDITLADPLEQLREDSDSQERGDLSFEDSFGGGDWQAFDLDESMEKDEQDKLNTSAVSDIEVAREADGTLPALDESSMMMVLNDKSLRDDSVAMDEQPEFNIDAYDEMLMENDNALEAPLSPGSYALEISSDLNVSINNESRTSLDFGAITEDSESADAARPKKKRKIGRDSVTELSSSFLKKVCRRV